MKKLTTSEHEISRKSKPNLYFTVKKRLKSFFFIATLFISINAFAQWPGNAPINPPVDSFRIDGTLKATTAVGDWLSGTGSGGFVIQQVAGIWGPINSTTTKFAKDSFDNSTDRIFTGSSFGDNPNTWSWTTGKPTSKCDINTVMLHVSSSANSKWIIMAGDRLTTTGTSYIDFEFSQGLFTRTNTGFSSLSATGGSLAATNGRTPGDFVLSMEYSNGGSNATVHYYVWEVSGATYKFVEHTIPFILAPLEPVGAVSAYGKTNADSVDVPFGAFGRLKYQPYAFVEAAVNIDAILGGSCGGTGLNIKSIFVKTKASDAYNAALKDFVEPQAVSFSFGSESMNYGDGTFCKTEGTATPTKSGTGTFSASKYGTDSLPPGIVWVGGGSTSTSGIIDLALSAADTFVITYTFSAGGGCSGSQKDTITINNATAGSIAASQTICSGGDPAAFTSVAGSGAGVLTYQWQSSTTDCTSGFTNIVSNSTSATYDPPSGLTTTTYYRRIAFSTVNSEACRDTSNCLTVTVNAITAGTIAASQTICSGGDPAGFTQSAAAAASGSLTYQWQKSTTDCNTGFTNITDANATTYDAPALTQTTYYRRIDTSTVNGLKCTAITNCVIVTVNAITAGTIAASQTICSGDDPAGFTQSAAATASGVLSYQWQKSTTDCNSGFTSIAGANASTYDAPALTQTTYYRRIDTSTVNGVKCTAITNCVTVTINAIAAGTIAGTQAICSGGAPSAFSQSLAAIASGSLSYLWQKSTIDCNSGFTSIANATTYGAPSGLTQTTYYRRIDTSTVDGVKCLATTNCLTITINTPPQAPGTTYNAPACDEETFSVTVSNVQQGASYTIVDKNGDPIPGVSPASPHIAANSNDFSFSNIPAGSGFSVTVVGDNGCAPTGEIPLPTCGTPDLLRAGKTNSSPTVAEKSIPAVKQEMIPSVLGVKAYPNPFNDRVKFIVTVPQAGQGTLELMNIQGQKLKTIFSGQFVKGGQQFEMELPALRNTTLIYVFRMGGKQITGKLVQLAQ